MTRGGGWSGSGDDWRVVSIGKKAVRDAVNLRSRERRNYFFVRHFKMQLYGTTNVNDRLTIKDDQTSVNIKAVTVIGAFLNAMKAVALEQIKSASPSAITEADILWVVTVPAIWREGGKRLMRLSAESGGLIKPGRSASLLLALEPEAASIWCLSTPYSGIEKGETVVVADCGGGTIDVTVHTVINREETVVKEALPCDGGDWGSTVIDRQFFKLLDDLAGSSFMAEFKNKHPSDWVELVDAWETSKCSFSDTGVNIKLPSQIAAHIGTQGDIDVYNSRQETDYELDDGRLYIDRNDMVKLFAPAVKTTVEHVRSTLAKLPDTKAIFIVGNFANCTILQKAFRDAFEERCKVLVPPQPGDCIMKGAVMLGNAPQSVAERISKYAYGVANYPPFDPEVHSLAYKEIIEGKAYAKNQASWLVKYGEKVPFGKVVTEEYIPIYTGQTSIGFEVYEGRAAGITYLSEDAKNVRKLGYIKSAKTDSDSLKKHGVKFTMLFGFSELAVKTELVDGSVTEASLVRVGLG
ncbi:hypothetical protein HK405_015098 [Cladochytrium tenue]|nr:hypothetical protein HK405_015098 [Cladochytrium tenue]